ncbi:MAG: hypothetical protein JSS81_21830 [Acidobacteria bacterium]|nr:hypothetical protein [Acidobacteriota bacterium]
MPSIRCKQCNLVNFSTESHCKRCGNQLNEYAPIADQRSYQTNIEQGFQTQAYPPTTGQTGFGQNPPPAAGFEQGYPSQQFQENYGQNFNSQYQNSYGQNQQQYQGGFGQNPPPQNYGQAAFQTPPAPGFGGQMPANQTYGAPAYPAPTAYQHANQYQNPAPAAYQSYQPPPPPSYYQRPEPQTMLYSCIKCGTASNVSIHQFKREYIPRGAFFAIFLGLLPGILIILLLKVKHELEAPFCDECWKNYQPIESYETFIGLGFFLGLILAIVLGIAAGSFFIFLLVFGAVIAGVALGNSHCKKYNLTYKTFSKNEVIVTDPLHGDVRLI